MYASLKKEENMKTLPIFVVAVAAAVLLGFGSSYLFAGHEGKPLTMEQQSECWGLFEAMDGGDKGYVTFYEFYNATHGKGGHKGLAPIGSGATKFYSADKDGDNRLTKGEYCAWRFRQTM